MLTAITFESIHEVEDMSIANMRVVHRMVEMVAQYIQWSHIKVHACSHSEQKSTLRPGLKRRDETGNGTNEPRWHMQDCLRD